MSQDSNRRSGRWQDGKKYGKGGPRRGFQSKGPKSFGKGGLQTFGEHSSQSFGERRSHAAGKGRPRAAQDKTGRFRFPDTVDDSHTPVMTDPNVTDLNMKAPNLTDPNTTDHLRFEDELVFGRNAVREAVQAGLSLNKIYVAEGEEGGLGGDRRLKDIYQEAIDKGYLVQLVPKAKLDRLCAGHQGKHQGIAAMAAPIAYADPYDVLKTALNQKEQVTVILLDQIEDSYNLASMIRSAECAGADLIVMPERRSVAVNYLVARESAGALAHVPVARVGNLRHFMKTLKDQNFWIYGLDMGGTVNYRHEKYPDRVAIVTGNEGKGLRPSTLQDCDFTLSIPMQGKINSLNAAVATALVLFEIAGSRADAC